MGSNRSSIAAIPQQYDDGSNVKLESRKFFCAGRSGEEWESANKDALPQCTESYTVNQLNVNCAIQIIQMTTSDTEIVMFRFAHRYSWSHKKRET